MTPVRNGKIQRFLGISITLHSKKGISTKIGDGLLITDGEKVHVWTGKYSGNGSFIIPSASVKELDAKTLTKATYRNSETGNFETFLFC